MNKRDLKAAWAAIRTTTPMPMKAGAAAGILRAAHHGVPKMPTSGNGATVPPVACCCDGCMAAWKVAHRMYGGFAR